MRKSRLKLLIALIGFGTTVVLVQAAEIVNVATITRNGHVLVSFELTGAFTQEIRSTIESGLPTTFQYHVRLKREAVFWPDSTVASTILATTVRYDNLTEQYNVARMLDGRVEDTMIMDDESEVRAALTRFDRMPLFSTVGLEANEAYHVRVRMEMRPRNSWFIWPWVSSSAIGESRFTFLL
jgi:hypothetical protein